MSILVVGSIAYDSVETPLEKRERMLGGSATYFSYAASFFSPVRLVGVVGEDFDQDHIDMLEGIGADLEGLITSPGKTFAYGCRYETDMNVRTTLFTDLNVFADFQPELPEKFQKTETVFLANIHPDLQHHVLDQVVKPRLVAADTMNLWINTARDSLMALLKRIDILVINDEEARMLSGEIHLPRAARKILGWGPSRIVVKKGEHGVSMFSGDNVFVLPAFPVADVYDPTGAGDCFAGGFMGYLAGLENPDESAMRRAVVYGSSVASFAVEKFSFDRLLVLTREEIDERVRQFQHLCAFDLQ